MNDEEIELLKALARFVLATLPRAKGTAWEEDSLGKALLNMERKQMKTRQQRRQNAIEIIEVCEKCEVTGGHDGEDPPNLFPCAAHAGLANYFML